jgi:hypothetical protein
VDDDDGTIGCLTAKVCHLRSLYFKQQAQIVKLAPALNKKVLNPTGIQRQNVLLCVRLFDEKNFSALRVKTNLAIRLYAESVSWKQYLHGGK